MDSTRDKQREFCQAYGGQRPRKLLRLYTESEAQFLTRIQATYGLDCTLLYGRHGNVVSATYQPAPIVGAQSPEPEKQYECEADKPEGTRDVDKFLKEQQDKLWRDD